jgi:hypothetical protein
MMDLKNFNNNISSLYRNKNYATAEEEDCKRILADYCASKKGIFTSAASGGDKQIILQALAGLRLSQAEATIILNSFKVSSAATKVEAGVGVSFARIDLINQVITSLNKLKDDHRSLSLFHYGSTCSYKVAHDYLKALSAGEGKELQFVGKGYGALLFGATRYCLSLHPDIDNQSIDRLTDNREDLEVHLGSSQQQSVIQEASSHKSIIPGDSFEQLVVQDLPQKFKDSILVEEPALQEGNERLALKANNLSLKQVIDVINQSIGQSLSSGGDALDSKRSLWMVFALLKTLGVGFFTKYNNGLSEILIDQSQQQVRVRIAEGRDAIKKMLDDYIKPEALDIIIGGAYIDEQRWKINKFISHQMLLLKLPHQERYTAIDPKSAVGRFFSAPELVPGGHNLINQNVVAAGYQTAVATDCVNHCGSLAAILIVQYLYHDLSLDLSTICANIFNHLGGEKGSIKFANNLALISEQYKS